MTFSISEKTVWVTGHKGFVGARLAARLTTEGAQVIGTTRDELDLRDQAATRDFMAQNRPDAIVMGAAVVGGIKANAEYPAQFLYDNLAIANNVIHAAHEQGVEKLMFLGSSCIYPRLAPQPITEDLLLSGALEPTNEWYAVAKIAGLKLCQAYRRQYGDDFIVAVPANLYGPGDDFDLATGHVVSALMARMHAAMENDDEAMTVWGSGKPTRDFFFVDDCVDGLVHLLGDYSEEAPINVGTGLEVSIRELAAAIAKVVGFSGRLDFDTSKPDGMPRKILDVSRIQATGWRAKTSLDAGLKATYKWFTSEGGQGAAKATI